MKKSYFIIFILGLMISCGDAMAAQITLSPQEKNTPELGNIIILRGGIVSSDLIRFQNITKQAGKVATVFLDSPGGNLKAGIEIGREIYRRGYHTAVTNMCASACALIWLAGKSRFTTKYAKIGFHVAYENGVEKRVSGMANAFVGLYVGELGFGENVVSYVTLAAPQGMQWLKSQDAILLGISTIDLTQKVAAIPAIRDIPPPKPSKLNLSKYKQDALAVVFENIRLHAKSGARALKFVDRLYARRVDYYGKTITLGAIHADKKKYFIRWPKRTTVIDYSKVKVGCEGDICVVGGEYFWQVANPKLNKHLSGTASFLYGMMMKPKIRVFLEGGKIIKRDK